MRGKKGSWDLRSEFNMSVLNLHKLDQLQRLADRYSIECSNMKLRNLLPYFNTLRAIYRYIRPLLNDTYKERYDERFRKIADKLYKELKFTWSTFLVLEKLHIDIYETMQLYNLSFAASKDIRYAEKHLKPEFV